MASAAVIQPIFGFSLGTPPFCPERELQNSGTLTGPCVKRKTFIGGSTVFGNRNPVRSVLWFRLPYESSPVERSSQYEISQVAHFTRPVLGFGFSFPHTDNSARLICLRVEAHVRPGTEIEELYRRHGAALVLFARAISGDRGRAQDAVHQVFLKLLESAGVDRAIDPKAYLFQGVRNTVFNDLKRQHRQVELHPDSAWFEPPERDHARERTLRRALSELAPDQREVVVLHVWGELTFTQVAEVLGISSNTAASRYRYALNKLRDVMCAKEDCRADVGR